MKKLYIIKVGTTFGTTAQNLGDFDKWTTDAIGVVKVETCSLDVEHGAELPRADACAGVVITGSHAMVTDHLPWSVKLEQWIPSLLDAQVPLFGICYGHQLLAQATGGDVGFHPQGKEIGTVSIQLNPECVSDPLFQSLPTSFLVHTTHSQTVLSLPPGAICLASNDFEPNHAFRLGDCAWGVQFHPEYNGDIMRSYVQEQAEELATTGRNSAAIINAVAETPIAATTLINFARIVEEKLTTDEQQKN
ncbi:GMP synthase (glutamine-hydrolysing) [Desulfuromusa kysingii]|uniref:GMP synthase (Glutamine-hydrolysing) n=1 Tax=Desulfuromusa kysingii TaxID=37625 RepID=A0A1H4AYC2_9BACT|nr:glutamine amidotransferase [Desulfuromusa kysingii]SEA40870.1 GMP synthase (glutamine-hydrolysing) [Desulfuromusa kysingii]